MKPVKGLSLDATPENQPEGTYPFGKNGIQNYLNGSIINEEGFEVEAFPIPAGYKINGILETDTKAVIVFYTNDINSGVMLYNLETSTVLYNVLDATTAYLLGFKIDNYITGEVQRNNKGELVCAFTDKVTFPKFVNLEVPVPTSLKQWRLFPEFDAPTITKQLLAGGNTEVGAYYFAARYYGIDGTVTSFSAVSEAIITTSTDGSEYSDKAIGLSVSNQDTSYSYLELAVIRKSKNGTKAFLIEKFPVLSGTYVHVITGEELVTEISLEEVLVPQIRYSKVGTIGQLNDALYVANLEKEPNILDMQKYANLVKIEWVSELIDAVSPPEEHINGTKKSLMHEETYAIYIRYKLASGSYTGSFIVPGVAATAANLLVSTVGVTGGLPAGLTYEVEDTISIYSTSNFSGVPGVYVNKTELYPNNDNFNSQPLGGEDLRSTPVRHHKMPSLRWCKENLYSSEADYGKTKLDLLGIRASNIIIPSEYSSLIVGYELLYAKRTIQNMTVYGQSIVLHGSNESNSSTVSNPTTLYSNGHNWNIVEPLGFVLDNSSFRFHSFDLLFSRPAIKPAFISHQYKQTTKTRQLYTPWSFPTSGTVLDGKGISIHLADNTDADGSITAVNPLSYVNACYKNEYVKNHSTKGDLINTYLETTYSGKMLGPAQPLGFVGNVAPLGLNGTLNTNAYLSNLCDIKSDIYNTFYSQSLISAGPSKALTDTSAFWGGDVFISLYTFHTYGYMDRDWDVPYTGGSGEFAYPENRTRRVVHRFICETIANHNARTETIGNIYSQWYDNNTLLLYNGSFATLYPAEYNSTIDPNQFGYTKGLEGVNDFVSTIIYTPYREYLYKFPYRIHRGGKLSRQSTRNWKNFIALDYYETQKNMGEIVNLEGMQDRLLIHHENALFMTQDKTKLESGLLGVTLGSGDIFQFEPQEAQASKLGFGGTQHDLACVKTPIGYLFPDSKQGEIYLYTNKQLTNITQDISNFLKAFLVVRSKNSFNGNGITIGWDQKYRRFLLTVNNKVPKRGIDAGIDLKLEDILSEDGGVLTTTVGEITPGEFVFMNGRYLEYMGLNDSLLTEADCPPDPILCGPITDLIVTVTSETTATVGWSGSPVYWELYKEEASGWVLIDSANLNAESLSLTSLVSGEVYKIIVTRVCDTGFSIPVTSMFFIEPVVPVDPCSPEGTTFNVIEQTWMQMITAPPNINGLGWRLRANNGVWTNPDDYGSNPNITLDDPSFEACLEIEIMQRTGVSDWWHPLDTGFPGFNYAVQHMVVDAIDRTNPPLGASVNMSVLYTSPFFSAYNYKEFMIPDPSTAYTAFDRYGNSCTGYWRWKSLPQRAWLGGSTVVSDPYLGPIGPMTQLDIHLFETY